MNFNIGSLNLILDTPSLIQLNSTHTNYIMKSWKYKEEEEEDAPTMPVSIPILGATCTTDISLSDSDENEDGHDIASSSTETFFTEVHQLIK